MAMRFPYLAQRGTPNSLGHLLTMIASSAAFLSPALASPDCSHAGPRPSAVCAAKMDDCKHTSIVYVLAVMGRGSGLTEDKNISKLGSNAANDVWDVRHRKFVKDTVHQIYSNEASYQKLRAGIGPNMALALSRLIAGCNADTSVNVDAH